MKLAGCAVSASTTTISDVIRAQVVDHVFPYNDDRLTLADSQPRFVAPMSPERWTELITAWSGPEESHPVVVRMTLDCAERKETMVWLSASEAAAQLQLWLEEGWFQK